jgi:hypothetical protein
MSRDRKLKAPAMEISGPGRGPGGRQKGSLDHRSVACPVPGCLASIDPSRLMCRSDWRQVPRSVQNHVWATWRSGDAALSPEYRQAVRTAITAAAVFYQARDARAA